jgi:hypothetical protein
MMKARIIPSLLLLLVAGIWHSASAQDTKSGTYTAPSISAKSKQSAAEIEDIGQIEEQGTSLPFRDKLRVSVGMQTSYTTNALLSGNNNHSDVLFLPTLDVGFHTPLDKHFAFDLDASSQNAAYSRYQDRGFVGYDVLSTLDYHIKEGLPRFYVTVENYLYNTFDTGHLQTEAVGFTGGTDYGIPLNGGRTLGFIGYSLSEYVADPQIDTRLVNRAVVGFAHQLRSNLTAQVYYVYQYSDYNDFNRSDSKHTVSGALIYQFNDHWYGSLTSSYIDQSSTQPHASYQSFSTSLGLTLHF